MKREAGTCALLVALLASCSDEDAAIAARLTGGDPARGRRVLDRHGCGACHHIPDVPGARGLVGPDLAGFALRSYVAGTLPNRPDHLMHWIMHPQVVKPGNAMPDLDVGERDARDMAAHLYTLR